MREAHVEVIDDYIHMGIPLTDGMGWIDPDLLSCKEKNNMRNVDAELLEDYESCKNASTGKSTCGVLELTKLWGVVK